MNRLEERVADRLGLTGGDIIADAAGRIFTVVRNEDSGLLFAVHISGEGRAHPETRIEPISMMPVDYILQTYKPVATARMREHALEAQGLKIVPVEPIETAPKWPQKFLAYFPAEYGEPAFISITADCPERGPMIGAVEPTFWFPQARAAMLNAVEG